MIAEVLGIQETTTTRRFTGALVLLPDEVVETEVTVHGENIVAVGERWLPENGQGSVTEIDARGLFLAPGIIDIHGDAFERQLMPRPGVMFPLRAALLETNRQLASNGITTAYHAMTLSWEPGLRSLDTAHLLVDELSKLRSMLRVDNRLQLRWETFAFDAVPWIETLLAQCPTPALAFNDHTSMTMLDPAVPLQTRPFEQDPAFPVIDRDSKAVRHKLATKAKRSELSDEDYVDLLDKVWQRRTEVPDKIQHLAAVARAHDVPMLSHDDSQIETRTYYRELGATIAEFPMQESVARDALQKKDCIVFGAPNVVRGGSHIGSPSAADMVEKNCCHILASDYYYPSLLIAISQLESEAVRPMHELWRLVSSYPATALGLADRGDIGRGKRADLVLLDWQKGEQAIPRLVLSGGRVAYSTLDRW